MDPVQQSRLPARANRGVPRSRFDEDPAPTTIRTSPVVAVRAVAPVGNAVLPSTARRCLPVAQPRRHAQNPRAATPATTFLEEPQEQSDSESSQPMQEPQTTGRRNRRAPQIFDNSDELVSESQKSLRVRQAEINNANRARHQVQREGAAADQQTSRLNQNRQDHREARRVASIGREQTVSAAIQHARCSVGGADAQLSHLPSEVEHIPSNDVIFDLHDKNEDCAQLFFCESSGFNIRHDREDGKYWQPVPDVDKMRSIDVFAQVMSPTAPITVCASCGRKDVDTSGGVSVLLSELELLQTTNSERLERYWALPAQYRHHMTIALVGSQLYDVHLRFLDLSTEDIKVPLCSACFRDVSRGKRPQFNVGCGFDFGMLDFEPLTTAECAVTATCIRFQTVIKFRGTDAQGWCCVLVLQAEVTSCRCKRTCHTL